MGLDPVSDQARRAVALVRDNSKWDEGGQDYFDGEVEPCINGKAVALGAYLGQNVQGIVERLLGEQLGDGGWNCEAEGGSTRSSFNTTISVLEGLLEYERANGGSPNVTAARLRGQEYLLERRLLRRLSTGEVVDPAWTLFSFPTRWHYDVLRGLDYLRSADVAADERCAEAVDLVEKKRGEDGRGDLENTHPGRIHFDMEAGDGSQAVGTPSAPGGCWTGMSMPDRAWRRGPKRSGPASRRQSHDVESLGDLDRSAGSQLRRSLGEDQSLLEAVGADDRVPGHRVGAASRSG
jgi:hypothetical protein